MGSLSTLASEPEERRHRETKRLTLISIAVAIGGLVVAAVALYLNTRPDTPEERVAACRKAHDAPLKPDMSLALEVPRRYGDCSWPPVPGATKDGYYEITVTEHEIPGTAAALKYTSVQVFESKCTTYQLQYKFQSQGTIAVEKPLLVDSDQIVSMYNGEAVNMFQELEGFPFTPYEPGPGGLVVLTHLRYVLHQVMCVNPNQAPDAK